MSTAGRGDLMLDEVEVIYRRDKETLSQHEALKYLAEDEGTSFLRVTAQVGEAYGKPVYLEVYITAVPGQPCSIMCCSGKMTPDEAEAYAVLLITARLMAQTADRQRAEAVRT